MGYEVRNRCSNGRFCFFNTEYSSFSVFSRFISKRVPFMGRIEKTRKAVKKAFNIKRQRALDRVIEENLDSLVRFARLRTENIQDAEDLVHDAIVRLLDRDISAIKSELLKSYIFRIVYNLCIDYRRRPKTYVPLDDMRETYTDEDADEAEDVERISAMLGDLPEKEAEVIRMNAADGLSFVEISHILDVPVSTLKSRYKTGMEKLRKQYNQNR